MKAIDSPQPISSLAHDSELGRWTLWRCPPPPLLAPYVTELQGYVEQAGQPVVRDEYPSGLVHMIIVLDHGFWLKDDAASGGSRPLACTFVAGMHRLPATVGSGGDALCMQVDFTPLGARRFLGIDNAELTDQVVDLETLQPELDRVIRGRLLEARTWQQRFAWLQGCLARRILTAPDDDPRLVFAWRSLYASGGTMPVGVVAERLGISRKRLIDMFSRQIGVSPKVYARLVRFSRAVGMIQDQGLRRAVTLAEVAAACGYADQAHFNREFRAITGTTPTSLQRRAMPDGTGVLAEPR